jgi:GAF domain-containing protein
MGVALDRTIRTLLVDCDAGLRQKVVTELAEEGILVDTVTAESELFNLLQTSRGWYELLLVGQLENPPREKEILLEIRQQYPSIEIITITNSERASRTDWSMERLPWYTVDRMSGSKTIASLIRLTVKYQSERQQNLWLQALASAAERVGAAKSEDQLYQELYEEACELLPGLDGFLIAHYDEQANEVSFPFSYKHDRRIYIQARSGGKSLAEYVLLTKEPLLLPYGDEIFRLQHGLDSPNENLGYSRSEIVVPMFLEGGKIFGVVFASTNDPKVHYTNEHVQALTTFTNHATVAIRNFIQIKEANQLRDATAALAGEHGREGVLRAIIEGAHQIVNSDFTGLILCEEDGTLQKARPVIPEDYFDKFGEPRQVGGLTRAVIESRRPKNIPDTSKSQLVKDSVRAAGIKSMLVLPLIHGDRVLGVLYTHTFAFREFVARDVALWTAFATQAASALDRVIEEEHQIRDYQRLVRELGRLEEPLGLNETLTTVATAAKSVFDSDSCRLFYIDAITGKVVDTGCAEGDRVEYHIDNRPRPNGLTQHVLRTKKPYYYPDMKDYGPAPRSELFSEGLISAASIPLRYGKRDIGVLHCNYFTKKITYNEHYKTLLEAFGARAAVALNRAARQYKASIWHGLDREIISCTEVSQLYQLFTRKANEALGADFSVFYPFDPTSVETNQMTLEDECVLVGALERAWQQPKGGRGGGVFHKIASGKTMLIVNELDHRSGHFSSRLARREGVRAFVAMRLEVIMPDKKEPKLAGILFVNYRQPATLKEADLADLRSASKLIAAGILRLSLQAELQRTFKQSNDQLRAVIEIFRTHESKSRESNLDHIAEHAARALGLDVCTILEFDPRSQKFTGRGNFGLMQPEYSNITLRSRFKNTYMLKDGPVVILDVRKDPLMRVSKFVRREGVRSTIVCPLRVEGESLGLLFGNYRTHTEPSPNALEAFSLFADVAAHVLHQANLESKFNESQLKEERRRLLVWVSMVEDMWQHTLVQKASAIRNHAFTLLKRLERHPQLPESMASVREIITEMDRLASDIASAPPRVPHDSEMNIELVPIGSLLQEIAERELRSMRLQGNDLYRIEVDVKALRGAQVHGYRRWLIYTFESLFQNAYAAMPQGGQITITGSRQGHWAEIRIHDTGKGVPRRVRDKIFKVAITARGGHKGLGIGSLLVTTLIEENRGTVELERPGPGNTTVLIRLPIGRQAKKR